MDCGRPYVRIYRLGGFNQCYRYTKPAEPDRGKQADWSPPGNDHPFTVFISYQFITLAIAWSPVSQYVLLLMAFANCDSLIEKEF